MALFFFFLLTIEAVFCFLLISMSAPERTCHFILGPHRNEFRRMDRVGIA
jgi:hypothetical protein